MSCCLPLFGKQNKKREEEEKGLLQEREVLLPPAQAGEHASTNNHHHHHTEAATTTRAAAQESVNPRPEEEAETATSSDNFDLRRVFSRGVLPPGSGNLSSDDLAKEAGISQHRDSLTQLSIPENAEYVELSQDKLRLDRLFSRGANQSPTAKSGSTPKGASSRSSLANTVQSAPFEEDSGNFRTERLFSRGALLSGGAIEGSSGGGTINSNNNAQGGE